MAVKIVVQGVVYSANPSVLFRNSHLGVGLMYKSGDSNFGMSLLLSFIAFLGFDFIICTAYMYGINASNFK